MSRTAMHVIVDRPETLLTLSGRTLLELCLAKLPGVRGIDKTLLRGHVLEGVLQPPQVTQVHTAFEAMGKTFGEVRVTPFTPGPLSFGRAWPTFPEDGYASRAVILPLNPFLTQHSMDACIAAVEDGADIAFPTHATTGFREGLNDNLQQLKLATWNGLYAAFKAGKTTPKFTKTFLLDTPAKEVLSAENGGFELLQASWYAT